MSSESTRSKWFKDVLPEVRCENCKSWKPPSDFAKEYMNSTEGTCRAIAAAGGAFHNAGTEPDMFCSEFDMKDHV